MTEKQKRNIVILSLCAIVFLMFVGYAAFNTLLTINGTASITSNWNVVITGIEEKARVGEASNTLEYPKYENLSATFKVNLINPGDSITYDITVKNEGTINAILEKVDISKTVNKAINITYEGITAGDKLDVGASDILTVKIEYNPEVTSQPATTESLFNMNLNYAEEGKSNTPETNISQILNIGGINVPIVKTEDGLYEDTYEPGRYIYKGANPNNYITFNGEQWRIVSIETDDTIKIVKALALPSQPFDTEGLRTTEYCAKAVLSGTWKGCNIWATTSEFDNNSTLPNGVKGKIVADSSLKTYLNGTYYEGLTANKKAIQKHNFYYGSATFNNPDLASQIISEKKYFVSSNVGLIQASDYIKANTDITNCGSFKLVRSNNTLCKTTNWLNPTRACYWTITPLYVNDGGAASSAMYTILVDPVGFLGHHNAASTVINVDPVVYLKASTKLSGDGTPEEPFKITNYIE